MELKEFLSSPGRQIASLHLPNEDKSQVKAVAQELIQKIQQEVKQTSVLVGGSYGKGTYVNGRKEVDIVFTCLNEEVPLAEFRENLWEAAASVSRKTNEFSSITLPRQHRRYSRMLKYKGVKFDILAAVPIEEARDFLRFPENKTAEMSASASKFQKKFVKSQPTPCKELIRYSKQWREFFTWEGRNKPTSYLIELLCIHAYELHLKENGSFDLAEAFQRFLKLVIRKKIFKFWTTFYTEQVGLKAREQRFSEEKRVILDPGNPANNVATSALRDWDQFVERARFTLNELEDEDE